MGLKMYKKKTAEEAYGTKNHPFVDTGYVIDSAKATKKNPKPKMKK